MITVERLQEGYRRAKAAGDSESLNVIAGALKRMDAAIPTEAEASASPEAPVNPEAQQFYAEKPPGELATPLFSSRTPPEQATGGTASPSPELVADILKFQGKGQTPTQAIVEKQMPYFSSLGSVEDVFNEQIVKGALSPSTSFDPTEYPTLSKLWEGYKQQMEPSMLGATARGAVSAIGPTIGAVGGAAAGSVLAPLAGPAAPLVPIGGGVAGSVAGGKAQELAQEIFRSPQSIAASKAQAAFDAARTGTRWSRIIGEQLPQFATGTVRPGLPAANTVKELAARTAIQAGAGAGISAGMDVVSGGPVDIERAAAAALTAPLSQPTRFGQRLFDKAERTDAAAIDARNKTLEYFTKKENVPEVIAALEAEKAGAGFTREGVNPLLGEITGLVDLMALQQAARNMPGKAGKSGTRLREQSVKNVNQLTENVSAVLREMGATPDESKAFLERLNAKTLAGASSEAEATRAAGITESQQLIDAVDAEILRLQQEGQSQAAAILQKASTEADAIQTAVKTGLTTAEEAATKVEDVLNLALSELKSKAGAIDVDQNVTTVKNQASGFAFGALSRLDAGAKKRANEMSLNGQFDEEPIQVNFMKAAANAFNEARQTAAESKVVKQILKLSGDGEGKTIPFKTVKTLREELNDEISSAVSDGKSNVARKLNDVKRGIDADIEPNEGLSEGFKAARRAWLDYASTFRDGKIGEVLSATNERSPEQVLRYILTDETQAKALRRAIGNDPEAIKAVTNYLVADVAEGLPLNPSAEAIRRVLDSSEKVALMGSSGFPEAREALQSLVKPIEAAQQQVSPAAKAVEAANAGIASAKQEARQILDAAKTESQAVLKELKEATQAQRKDIKARSEQVIADANIKAQQLMKDAEDAVASSVATKFIGKDPSAAISEIAEGGKIQKDMQALMNMARMDSSGKAVEGVQNAVRTYVSQKIRLAGSASAGANRPGQAVPVEKQPISLKKVSDMVSRGGNMRPLLEEAFGKGSKEMNALDLANSQLDVMARPLKVSPGESPTQFLKSLDEQMGGQLQKNALGYISRIARGISPEQIAASRTKNVIQGIGDLVSVIWKGDVQKKASEYIVTAISDPKVALDAYKTINEGNLPAFKKALIEWTIANQKRDIAPRFIMTPLEQEKQKEEKK